LSSRFLTAVVALATVAYPLVIYLALGRVEPRWMALLLVLLGLARAWVTREPFWLVAAAGAAVLGGVTLLGNSVLPLKLYPVLVSTVLFAVFAASLARPPSAIERLARLTDPDLPPAAVAYTRRVTQVWCGFFVFNGTVSLGTALWGSPATWALYNGLLAYVLMGVLFGGEWLMRRRVKARIAAGEAHV
jgi:uncharacterized membrane protein